MIVNYTPKRGLGSSLSVLAAEGTDEEQTDGMVATEAIKLMEQHRNEPFFIAAGFYRPHCPYIAPKKYFDLYPLEQIQLPEITDAEFNDVPDIALASTQPRPWFGVTELEARLSKQAYYATISFVDAQIGRLLDAVERLGLKERTLIVFWSDHGYHQGEHGLWKKQSNFEESARAPFIMAGPGVKGRGVACPSPVEFVDIYPTVADLAGVKPPAGLQGVSLRPLLENPAAAWDRPAYTQVQRGRKPGHSVRTKRWRYIEWNNGRDGAQLYDHDNDPSELKNLVNDPAHAGVVAEMKELVRGNWPQGSYSNQSAND
ncbi:MAG: sulfatase [Rhodospirillales bacterium]|nr:sulfatase [Rhodospirillales bacterium]